MKQSDTRPLIAAISRGEIDRVPPLLEKGFDPNDTWFDGDQETPLMVAAGSGYEEVVDQLLAAGADASLRDTWGRTACIWAAETHRNKLVEKLWQSETGNPSSAPTQQDLFLTKLDEIETPLSSSKEFIVLQAYSYHPFGAGLLLEGLGADDNYDHALSRISNDNDRMRETGPYLLCRRLSLEGGISERPTNPLAKSIDCHQINRSQWMVLAHLPTASTSPGRSISQQHNPVFRGWAAITGIFSGTEMADAKAAANSEPGRATLVELLDVCTCYEGRVESYESLVEKEEKPYAEGPSRTIEPGGRSFTAETSPSPSHPPPDESEPSEAQKERPGFRPVTGTGDFNINSGYQLFRRFPAGFMAFAILTVVLGIVFFLGVASLPIWISVIGSSVLLGPLLAGFIEVSLAIAAGRSVRFFDFFLGYRHVWPVGCFSILVWGLGLLTMSVPLVGILALYLGIGCMYVLTLISDQGLGLLPALAESFRRTHRQFIDSMFQWLVIVLTAFAGIALLGIGFLVSLPLAGCILTAAYKRNAS